MNCQTVERQTEQEGIERGRDLQFWYGLLKGRGYDVKWAGAHGDRYLLVNGARDTWLIREVIDAEPQQLFDILDGKREPIIMEHISRIVGYYSKMKNWNKSKLGELADRRKGDYGLK